MNHRTGSGLTRPQSRTSSGRRPEPRVPSARTPLHIRSQRTKNQKPMPSNDETATQSTVEEDRSSSLPSLTRTDLTLRSDHTVIVVETMQPTFDPIDFPANEASPHMLGSPSEPLFELPSTPNEEDDGSEEENAQTDSPPKALDDACNDDHPCDQQPPEPTEITISSNDPQLTEPPPAADPPRTFGSSSESQTSLEDSPSPPVATPIIVVDEESQYAPISMIVASPDSSFLPTPSPQFGAYSLGGSVMEPTEHESGGRPSNHVDMDPPKGRKSLRVEKFLGDMAVNHKVTLSELQKIIGIEVSKDVLDKDKNFRKAACFVADAFSGRLHHGLGSTFERSALVKYAFRIHKSWLYHTCLWLVSVCIMGLVYFEPASYRRRFDTSPESTLLAKVVELSFILFMTSDITLRVLYMGWRAILKKRYFKMEAVVLLICLADVLVAMVIGRNAIRLSRPIRPFLFVMVDKSTLNLARQCIAAEKKLRTLAGLIIFSVIILSIFVSSFCSDVAWDALQADERTSEILGQPWSRSWRPFESLAYGLTPLFAIVTTEGYQELAFPWTVAYPELALVFYAIIILGTYTMVNLAIATQVDEFQRLHTKSTTKEETKMMQALTVAFFLVRDDTTHTLSFLNFQRLILAWRPQMKQNFVNILFQNIARQGQDIDLGQFLDVCDGLRSSEALNGRNYKRKASTIERAFSRAGRSLSRTAGLNHKQKSPMKLNTRRFISPSTEVALMDMLNSKSWQIFTNSILVVNIGLVGSLNDRHASEFSDAVIWADFGMLAFYCVEVGLGIWILGWQVYKTKVWNQMQMASMLAALGILILTPALNVYFGQRLKLRNPAFSIHKLALCPRAFRFLKGFTGVEQYITLFLRVMPVLRDFAKVILCFMYAHGVLCLEILGDSGFYSTARNATLTNLSLLQLDGWQDILFTIWEPLSPAEQAIASLLVYGFVWYFAIIVLSQLMAILYDLFKVHRNMQLANTRQRKQSGLLPELGHKGNTPWRFYAIEQTSQAIRNKLVKEVQANESGTSLAAFRL